MTFLRNLFGGNRRAETGAQAATAKVIRWTEDSEDLNIEDCARSGSEALAAFLIDADIFGAQNVGGNTFTLCAEFYHAKGGTEDNPADFDYIGVYLRTVQWINGTYPQVAEETLKMLIQPLDDGSRFARWNSIDRSRATESLHGIGMMVEDSNTREGLTTPRPLGEIPPQAEDDYTLPSFLFIHQLGQGWQIWRRFAPVAAEDAAVREERCVPVFPAYTPADSWLFRLRTTEDGGLSIETVRGE